MTLREMTAREALQSVDALLRELLHHPAMTAQDKAAIILAKSDLAGIELRHMPRWTPVNPAALPAGRVQAFALVTGLPKGRLLDWEEGQWVAS